MNHFVVVYDRSTGKLLTIDRFDEGQAESARAERARLELELRERSEIEVVMLGADSEDALRKTHARYFETASELAAS